MKSILSLSFGLSLFFEMRLLYVTQAGLKLMKANNSPGEDTENILKITINDLEYYTNLFGILFPILKHGIL